MKRKMAYVGSFWFIGLFLASFLSFSVNFALSLFTAAASVTALVLYKRKYLVYSVCALSVAAAVADLGLCECFVYRNVIKYAGYEVEVKGIITGYADHSGDKSSYTIKGVINGDVKTTVTCYTDSISAEVGDYINIVGTAEEFEDSYTFPARSYYMAKGIYLRINDVKYVSYSENTGFSLIKIFNSYREHIVSVINSEMGSREQAVMAAMLFGDKSDLESADKTLMCRAGIGHIMAVSGVHLSVVCTFFWYILSRLPVNKYIRFVLLLIPIFCFVLLAGMSNSVIRAAIMVILVHGANLFHRRADTLNSIGIAVIILTFFSPFTVRDSSFLLSAAGVFGAGVLAPAVIKAVQKKHKAGKLMKSVIVSMCVNAVIFPVSVMFFDEFSIISPISNLVLLPVCMAILVIGIIVTITGGVSFIAVPVLRICIVLCDAVIAVSEFTGNLHFLYIPLGSDIVKAAAVTAVILTSAAFAIFRRADVTAVCAAALLSFAVMAVNLYRIIPDENITVAVLRNGSETAVVVHDRNSAGIINLSGGRKTASSVVKYLNRNGIYRIDALAVNSDANTALPVYSEYFKLFDVTRTFIPEEFSSFADKGIQGETVLTYKSYSGIELSGYTISFGDNGNILISCNGADIIFYPDELVTNDGITYQAAVRYSGTEPASDPDTEILAVMNAGASAIARSGQTVYIGENVKFRISADGNIKPDIIE